MGSPDAKVKKSTRPPILNIKAQRPTESGSIWSGMLFKAIEHTVDLSGDSHLNMGSRRVSLGNVIVHGHDQAVYFCVGTPMDMNYSLDQPFAWRKENLGHYEGIAKDGVLFINFADEGAIENVNIAKTFQGSIGTRLIQFWAKRRNAFSLDDFSNALRVAPRTYQRWLDVDSPNKPLTPTQSEGFTYFEHVFQRSIAVLGDEVSATAWLKTPSRIFDGETPIGMLNTTLGAKLVLDQLTRIEYGVLS
jgi:putative toxin-antitoxin system antitoxin component (TIGR02293 family)